MVLLFISNVCHEGRRDSEMQTSLTDPALTLMQTELSVFRLTRQLWALLTSTIWKFLTLAL